MAAPKLRAMWLDAFSVGGDAYSTGGRISVNAGNRDATIGAVRRQLIRSTAP